MLYSSVHCETVSFSHGPVLPPGLSLEVKSFCFYVGHITYIVLVQTLNHAQSINSAFM